MVVVVKSEECGEELRRGIMVSIVGERIGLVFC